MADNIDITAGSGTTIATDDCTTGHVQVVKLAYGADGNRTQVPADADGLLVNLGANNDVTVTSISAGDNNIGNVDIVTMPNVTLAAGTNTNEIVGDVAHDVAAAGNPVLVGGYAKAAAPTDVDADGDAVRAWMLRNGATCVQLTAAGTLIASGNGTAATAARVTIASDSTGQVVLAAGSAAIGKLAANSGVDIGDIDVTSVIAGTGATNLGKAIDTAAGATDTGVAALAVRDDALSTLTPAETDYVPLRTDSTGALWVATDDTINTSPAGNVAHDAGDSGNPIKIGAKAETSPKGITAVADGDRTDLYADSDGMLMVKLNTSFGDLVSEVVTNTNGTSTAFSNFSGVASTRNYVTAITVYNSSATAGTVDFRDGTGGSVLWTMPIPAGGGSVIANAVPLFRTSANTALAFDVSGALSTVTICVSGFQSKV
jgi:hypothetical protein